VEEYSQSVIFEALKATAGALDLFDTEVLAFGGSVRRPGSVVVQDLVVPALQGVAERDDLRHLVCKTARDRLVEQHRRLGHVVGQIYVSY